MSSFFYSIYTARLKLNIPRWTAELYDKQAHRVSSLQQSTLWSTVTAIVRTSNCSFCTYRKVARELHPALEAAVSLCSSDSRKAVFPLAMSEFRDVDLNHFYTLLRIAITNPCPAVWFTLQGNSGQPGTPEHHARNCKYWRPRRKCTPQTKALLVIVEGVPVHASNNQVCWLLLEIRTYTCKTRK